MQQHPKCKCGKPVLAYTYMEPSYDDGGSVDAFSPEILFLEECADCIPLVQPEQESDALPF